MTDVRVAPVVVAVALLVGCADGSPREGIPVNSKLAGRTLPSADVADIAGASVDTGGLIGSPMVLNVWGSTCGPCKKELPDFAAAHATFGTRVRFVGLSYLPPSEREESFARERGVEYELLYDATGSFITSAGIVAFPVTLFVAADGTVVEQTGALDEARLSAIIEEVLL